MAKHAALSFVLIVALLGVVSGCASIRWWSNFRRRTSMGRWWRHRRWWSKRPKPVAVVKPAVVAPKKVAVPEIAGIPKEWTPKATKPDGWRYIVIHHSATPSAGAGVRQDAQGQGLG